MSQTVRPDDADGGVTRVHVEEPQGLPAALAACGLPHPVPVVVVVGGAGGLGADELARLTPVITGGLVPAVERAGALVVDGGTDAGVMRLLGEARAARSAEFLLVGVVARGTVRLPAGGPVRDDAEALEPHHTHFVVVPGTEWGEEVPWISRTATLLAGTARSVTVLVNGGDIAYRDAAASLAAGRPVLVVAGSGRSADQIARALRHEVSDSRAHAIASSDLISEVSIEDPHALDEAVTTALASPGP